MTHVIFPTECQVILPHLPSPNRCGNDPRTMIVLLGVRDDVSQIQSLLRAHVKYIT